MAAASLRLRVHGGSSGSSSGMVMLPSAASPASVVRVLLFVQLLWWRQPFAQCRHRADHPLMCCVSPGWCMPRHAD
jgi:hypothetical protein